MIPARKLVSIKFFELVRVFFEVSFEKPEEKNGALIIKHKYSMCEFIRILLRHLSKQSLAVNL